MEFDEVALARAGVTAATLVAEERAALDRDGFVLLRDVLSAEHLEGLRAEFEAAFEEERRAAGGGAAAARAESGTRHVGGLLARAPFRALAAEPRVLAAAHHVLRRVFFLPVMGGRDPQPGFGQQGLHADWNTPMEAERGAVATALALLDPFTAENGATRVVPGSHRARSLPPRETSAPAFVHPRQVGLVAPAGTVVVFNGHLLHSGTRHCSRGPRRAVQITFAGVELRWRFASSEPARAAG